MDSVEKIEKSAKEFDPLSQGVTCRQQEKHNYFTS